MEHRLIPIERPEINYVLVREEPTDDNKEGLHLALCGMPLVIFREI